MTIHLHKQRNEIDRLDVMVMGDKELGLEAGDVAIHTSNNDEIELCVNLRDWTQEGIEETCKKVCSIVLKYAMKNKLNSIGIDVKSLIHAGANCSYTTNVLLDSIVDIFEVNSDNPTLELYLFNSVKENSKYLREFEKAMSSSNDANASFGDDGDPLKDQYEEFQRHLKPDKLFRNYLIELIDSKGYLKYSHAYKAAGVSKSVFSRITNFDADPPHMPSRDTVAALTVGLRLSLEEASKFYNIAGYYLGKTDFVDRTIRFFIENKIYDIDEVNYCLDYYGYPPLGEKPREKFES